jgi:hypothetical protein
MAVIGDRLRHPDHSNRASVIQRCSCGRLTNSRKSCERCARGKRRRLSRHGKGHVDLDDNIKERVLAVLKERGEPLAVPVRNVMEQAFGSSFGDVRVHRDREAALTASLLSASAYTVGRHIVFAEGLYEPHTMAGLQLVAHELTHVVQQRGQVESATEGLVVGPEDDVLERAAKEAATSVAQGGRAAAQARFVPAARGQAVLQRDKKICGPDVTNQIRRIWAQIQTDFANWSTDKKDDACLRLVQPIANWGWNTDAFDVLPLYFIGANAWLMRTEVLDTPCGIPSPDPNSKWTHDEVERRDRCSLSVAVGNACWLSGTVNYGTYGIMMRLCKNQFPDQLYVVDPNYPYNAYDLGNGEALIRTYKAYKGRSGVKEYNLNEPISWYRATYTGRPGAKPGGPGNKVDCDASGRECTLDGSIVNWDYVWEPAKPRMPGLKVSLDVSKLPSNPANAPLDWAVGWWTVWDGNTYYYYFFGDNDVIYIKTLPSRSWIPPRTAGRKGRVERLEHGLKIFWPPFSDEVGTEETFTRMNWTSTTEMHGLSTKYSPLGASKL